MKSIRTVVYACCFTVFASNAAAQVHDTVRLAQSIWSMKKKEIVLRYMQLTEAEKSAFWPVYDHYSEAIRYLEMEHTQILSDYARDYKHLSIKEIESLSMKLLENDLVLAKVRKHYYRKFKRAVSPTRASEFMQLDNSLRAMIRFEAQKSIPPVEVSQVNIYSRNSY